MRRFVFGPTRYSCLALLFLLLPTPAQAQREPDREGHDRVVRDMLRAQFLPFGEDAVRFPFLQKYKSVDDVDYYRSPEVTRSDLFGSDPANVAFGFKAGKLYAYLVDMDTVSEFDAAVERMVALYGDPVVKREGYEDVYRWNTDALKVKLKYDTAEGKMKLGMYFRHLE